MRDKKLSRLQVALLFLSIAIMWGGALLIAFSYLLTGMAS